MLVLFILCGCTPMTSAQRSNQDSQQASDQESSQVAKMGMGHASRTSDMPIIIICNHVGTGDSQCIKRDVPGNEFQEILK
jgi:hypothetical protein